MHLARGARFLYWLLKAATYMRLDEYVATAYPASAPVLDKHLMADRAHDRAM